MFHDPCTDVSEARHPTRAQREVIDLLGMAPAAALVRLSLSDWRRVNDVVDALAQARTRPAVIPRPRAGAGGQDGVTADVRDLVGKVASAKVTAA
jgi:hypothetical protein